MNTRRNKTVFIVFAVADNPENMCSGVENTPFGVATAVTEGRRVTPLVQHYSLRNLRYKIETTRKVCI